jgi:hypothetical protein
MPRPPADPTLAPFPRPRLFLPWLRFPVASSRRRRLSAIALAILALAPVFHVFIHTADSRRDVVYWDEFDTALALVLQLKAGTTPSAFLESLFSLSNEHRMVTSRLLFAGSYWLTGTVNFALLDWIGNGTIVAACLLLIAAAGPRLRPLKLALLLAFLVFQLEHYENFLWSGSSIDHFQVILLATAAIVALHHGTWGGFWAGGLAAVLATFTLAHGVAVWPAGAALLWFSRRRRALAVWCALAGLAAALFLLGFHVNRAQGFAEVSLAGGLKVAGYWLSILGAVPGLGTPRLALLSGAALLALYVYLLTRGSLRREPIAWAVSAFLLAAAALIAIGRAEYSGGVVHSRYYILSAVAWALALFMLMERHTHPRRPLQALATVLPCLALFNLFANREFADETEAWITCRDMAAVSFQQYGADGRGPFPLHPHPERSTALLRQAAALGLYRLGPVCLPVAFPAQATETRQITYYVEEVTVRGSVAAVRGWAAIPGRESLRGTLHLVLKSAGSTHLFSTVTVPRNDVPTTMKQPGWLNAGFHFALPLAGMPSGDFQLGLLIMEGDRAEYIMTDHRLNTRAAAHRPARLASQ